MKFAGLAGGLIVGASLLLAVGEAEAEWRYTDAKGKTRTVPLRGDVPGEYRNTSVEVDTSPYNSNSRVAPGEATLPVQTVVPRAAR